MNVMTSRRRMFTEECKQDVQNDNTVADENGRRRWILTISRNRTPTSCSTSYYYSIPHVCLLPLGQSDSLLSFSCLTCCAVVLSVYMRTPWRETSWRPDVHVLLHPLASLYLHGDATGHVTQTHNCAGPPNTQYVDLGTFLNHPFSHITIIQVNVENGRIFPLKNKVKNKWCFV